MTEKERMKLERFGSSDPYKKCPVMQTEHFMLRMVELTDGEDLLKCYADPKAQRFFNSDNCTSDFCYETIGQMDTCIADWLEAYKVEGYVRFAIINKNIDKAVGTIEMFGNIGQYANPRGVLRIDICAEYEKAEYLSELIEVSIRALHGLFEVQYIITKAIPEATERVAILKEAGFIPFEFGPEETAREHYWQYEKQ